MNSSDTKKSIMKIARNLILSRGYNAFSYQDVADEIGIKKASIHYHFSSKAALGAAVIRRDRKRFQNWCKDLITRTDDIWQKLENYFQIFEYIRTQGNRICTACILTAEYVTLPKSMQKELKQLIDNELDWLTNILTEGRKSNMFSYIGEPNKKALQIQACLYGIMGVSRTHERMDWFYMVIDQLKTELRP
ncbi:MAG: TetR/AcrR family transcriptional regulator [Promethearchaeota archaeon]